MKEYKRIVLLDITEKCEELNSNNLYGIDDVRGVSNTKQFMKTINITLFAALMIFAAISCGKDDTLSTSNKEVELTGKDEVSTKE